MTRTLRRKKKSPAWHCQNKIQPPLEFCLGRRLELVHRLKQAQAAVLDCLGGLLLLVGLLFVLLVQALDESLEVRLKLLAFRLLLLDHCLTLLRAKRHELFDLLLFLIVAKIEVGWAASRAQSLGVSLEGLEVTATLVVLQIVWGTVLDRGVASDTH